MAREEGREKGLFFTMRAQQTLVTAILKVFFFLSEEEHTYLLVWECRLDHGTFKTVRPLELCLLP